jgi:biopolymer transport protein ExbB
LHHRRPSGASLAEAGGQDEFVTRAIRRAIAREAAGLEWGLTVLASVGSTAPFVGLLGTVWSIYLALTSIVAGSGKATLDAVAGPVGEALIMTACGLAVAIPAVLAYNAFVRANRLTLSELDGFAHDLHTFLATGRGRMNVLPGARAHRWRRCGAKRARERRDGVRRVQQRGGPASRWRRST